MKSSLLFALTLLFLLMINHPVHAVTPEPAGDIIDVAQDHAKGEIVIDLKENVPENAINGFMTRYGLTAIHNDPYSLKCRILESYVGEENMDRCIRLLSKDPAVKFVEPNYIYSALNYPNDPLYKYQWHMEKIKVRGAWKYTTGKNVIVAVIDTGVAYEDYKNFHRLQDLEWTKFASPYNFVARTTHANDDHAHGSHVAGTIAETTNNGKGAVGIAYDAKIMPLKVLSSAGMGRLSDIAEAIRYAADNGARVINMSLGGRIGASTLEDACKYAYNKGVTIVCAAGNDKSERVSYPAAYKECIAVSSIRDDDQLAPYTTRGPNIDIAAPGGDTTVDQNGDGYKDGVLQNTIKIRTPEEEDYLLFQGTSMASPHVAGVVALLESLGYTNPKVVKAILQKSARKKGLDLPKGYGAGILDAEKAVYLAGFIDGLIKLILAIVMVFFLLYSLRGVRGAALTVISPQFITGLIIGSCGLFFLPSMGVENIPFKNVLLRGFPQWDIAILGAEFHGNLLFYSALFPLVLSFIFFPSRFLNKLATGFTTGVAAHLLFFFIFRPAEIQFIPGFLFLDRIWLLFNIALSLYIAYIFTKPLPELDSSQADA